MSRVTVDYSFLTIADYDEVASLWIQTPGIRFSDADSRPALERYLHRNRDLSFVARISGRIVGTVLSGHDGRRGYLNHLLVVETHRRHGIGSHLVQLSIDALAREGITKTHLFVLNDNAAAFDFWRRRGWRRRSDVTLFSHASVPETESTLR
jgi:ribosomal protein S18 acetylase RimI-like enzyme